MTCFDLAHCRSSQSKNKLSLDYGVSVQTTALIAPVLLGTADARSAALALSALSANRRS